MKTADATLFDGGLDPTALARWRALAADMKLPKLPTGIDARVDGLVGAVRRRRREARYYLRRARHIHQQYLALTQLNADQRAAARDELLAVFRLGRETDDQRLRGIAFAGVMVSRHFGFTPHPVQFAAAAAMLDGRLVEMATGEGKTLTASLAAIPMAWRGRGCHVLTANDYLAERDADHLRPVYESCGVSVAHVTGEMKPPQRCRAYAADVTYCTSKEATADFLRDRLATRFVKNISTALLEQLTTPDHVDRGDVVMRGLHAAIVDEADSLLIDEAVTPLILSGEAPNQERVTAFAQAAEMARRFVADEHYRVNRRWRDIQLTSAGRELLAECAAGLGGLWAGPSRAEELLLQALEAVEFYRLGVQYVIDEGKIVIIDEFTGRLMPDRTWRGGVHQAVEAKEGLEIQPMKQTLGRLAFQRFFRMYPRLAGMTGTCWETRDELWRVYRLPVLRMPTHRPCIRREARPVIYRTAAARWEAVADMAELHHANGRPVLIGTRSVAASETLSEILTRRGLEHQVLNATRHREEAQIIAGAGQRGRITVATNMAGRGSDIKLGEGVAELGGLHVIATEAHESPRIDRQLSGRAARQGDPGSVAYLYSMEDELLLRFLRPWRRRLIRSLMLGGKTSHPLALRQVRRAQRVAEARAFRQRVNVIASEVQLQEMLSFAPPES